MYTRTLIPMCTLCRDRTVEKNQYCRGRMYVNILGIELSKINIRL